MVITVTILKQFTFLTLVLVGFQTYLSFDLVTDSDAICHFIQHAPATGGIALGLIQKFIVS